MAVEVTLTIPDAHATRVLEAFNTLAGANIELSAHDPEAFDGRWSFSFDPKGGSETNMEFAKRALKEVVVAMVRMVDFAEDEERYRTEVSAITRPQQDVPDEIIE